MDTFSESEARDKIGAVVVTVKDLPDVAVGTHGTVVEAVQGGERGWIVLVEWDLPPKRSEMLAQVWDLSFNLPWRNKIPKAELSKSDFKRLLAPLKPRKN